MIPFRQIPIEFSTWISISGIPFHFGCSPLFTLIFVCSWFRFFFFLFFPFFPIFYTRSVSFCWMRVFSILFIRNLFFFLSPFYSLFRSIFMWTNVNMRFRSFRLHVIVCVLVFELDLVIWINFLKSKSMRFHSLFTFSSGERNGKINLVTQSMPGYKSRFYENGFEL